MTKEEELAATITKDLIVKLIDKNILPSKHSLKKNVEKESVEEIGRYFLFLYEMISKNIIAMSCLHK